MNFMVIPQYQLKPLSKTTMLQCHARNPSAAVRGGSDRQQLRGTRGCCRVSDALIA